jgi:hypothetical protein
MWFGHVRIDVVVWAMDGMVEMVNIVMACGAGAKNTDMSPNPTEWIEVYQLIIKATRGDSYVMANYLPIFLSSSTRTWLMGLPTGLMRSWSDLCR